MNHKHLVAPFSVFLGLMLGGCVTGRRTISLGIPAASAAAEEVKDQFSLGPIADQRLFENEPGDPSTPSIDGDVTNLTPAQRSTFIGRQRGSFGKAYGDIVLPAGETVQMKVAELVRQGFARRGHAIAATQNGGNSVSIEIQDFWAWFTPGVFYFTFEAKLDCRFVVIQNGQTTRFHVKGYGENKGQVVKDGNWQEAYAPAFEDFLKNLDVALSDAGL
jgi:uncharacterized lipoprotein YajG